MLRRVGSVSTTSPRRVLGLGALGGDARARSGAQERILEAVAHARRHLALESWKQRLVHATLEARTCAPSQQKPRCRARHLLRHLLRHFAVLQLTQLPSPLRIRQHHGRRRLLLLEDNAVELRAEQLQHR